MKTLVVIPSAKRIPAELQADFGSLPSALIPLQHKPALQYLLEQYTASRAQCLVAGFESFNLLEEFLTHHSGVQLFNVGLTRSLGETIYKMLMSAKLPEHLVINFGDTWVERPLRGNDCIVCAKSDEIIRWTTFTTDGQRITDIYDKDTAKNSRLEHSLFVGVFEIAEPERFTTLLGEALQQATPLDPFYSAVLNYFNGSEKPLESLEYVTNWRDFGHLDTYYASKRSLSSGAREFNLVEIDAEKGVLRKTSQHGDKFREEIKWYLSLPSELSHLAPRIFEHRLEHGSTHVVMEYYSYPPLSDIYLHGAYDIGEWELILEALGSVLKEMQSYSVDLDAELQRRSSHLMYESKTLSRLQVINQSPLFEQFRHSIKVNHQRCMGLERFMEVLPDLTEKIKLYDNPHFSVIHGDFCLSNILFDRRNRIVRLIDPRGEFGGIGVYGDSLYDLAKLSHSLEGDYDFLVNNLFDLDISGQNILLQPHFTARHQRIRRLYQAWLERHYSKEQTRIRFIQSLLFISMVPLHSDRPRSQGAFLSRGLELASRIAEEEGFNVA